MLSVEPGYQRFKRNIPYLLVRNAYIAGLRPIMSHELSQETSHHVIHFFFLPSKLCRLSEVSSLRLMNDVMFSIFIRFFIFVAGKCFSASSQSLASRHGKSEVFLHHLSTDKVMFLVSSKCMIWRNISFRLVAGFLQRLSTSGVRTASCFVNGECF